MLLVKLPKGARHYERRAVFEFEIKDIDPSTVRSARLRLNLVPSGLGFAALLPKINQFAVFGITSDASTSPHPDDTWESIPTPDDGIRLGTFDVPRSAQRGVFGIESEPLLEFLRSNEKGSVVFLITRLTEERQGSGLVHAFASDSHPEASGPILELTFDEPQAP